MNNNTRLRNSLKDLGIENARFIINYQPELHDMTIASGQESKLVLLAVNTGEYTGRSPLDRFIVKTVFLKTKFGGEK
jgi:phosphoenolpyruvate carboxykinase (ATP)